MRFAVVLPWWGHVLVFASALALAWLAYARTPIPLTRSQRTSLTALRFLTLAALIVVWLRPVVLVPPAGGEHSVVPVLVDASRSMRLPDGHGTSRIERAKAIARELHATLADAYRVELLTFGETLAAGDVDRLAATARRSDLTDALAALADRYRGQRLAGIVVLSDGGDTSDQESHPAAALSKANAPVLTVGIGERTGVRDREIVNFTAGEPLLPGASIDLSVSAVSIGYGKEPVEIRVSESGRPVDVRRVTPPADGAPIHEVFTVAPSPDAATVYTVEIPVAAGELAGENNRRSLLLPPQVGKKRLLVVEGAPGFEHTFLKRALMRDPGLDVDAVVKKGRNDDGRDTFYVQAGGGRVGALANGFPAKKSQLFVYDGLIFGNVEAGFFTRAQLDLTAEFVASRGGGLLVLGAHSFDRQGLAGTALEEVLPIDLTDRASVARVAVTTPSVAPNMVALTLDGLQHPAMRLAASIEENRKRWTHLPALGSIAAIGGPRPGAQVLAVGADTGGELRPLLATQRYGQGRAAVFAGEASWRWRMMLPVTDTSYETIWRQMARWMTAGSPGQVTIAPMSPSAPGETGRIVVIARNDEFAPVGNAEVTVRLTAPDGQTRLLTPALTGPQDGRYTVAARFDQSGIYRIDASANSGGQSLGSSTRQVLVGGVDLEMSQPRLNESVLRRLAAASHGQYLSADESGKLPGLVRAAKVEPGAPEPRDLWHNGWSLLAIIGLLAAEWLLRRRVGFA
jgi:uncharacterized membrane protein